MKYFFPLATTVILALIIGVSFTSNDVTGANVTSDTSIARVYVWNTEPNITSVVITPGTIDLAAGNMTQANCTAYVWDYNGYQDVRFINATLFDETSSGGGVDDNNNHYTNSTGNCTGTLTNATCVASFNLWYYANNGTWTCNITIGDLGGAATARKHFFNESGTATARVNTVLGIDVPPEINYGNLSVTEVSNNISVNVTNWGNVRMNVSVRGYAGTGPQNNHSLACELGNITQGYQRYTSLPDTTFALMSNLTNISTMLPLFTLPVRVDDLTYGNDRNLTYWRLEVPLTVGGQCNGTIEFTATDASD